VRAAKKLVPNWVQCTDCKHCWVGFYLPQPIRDAVRAMSNLTCPRCAAGLDKISLYDGSAAG
jgi:hypothetical protein